MPIYEVDAGLRSGESGIVIHEGVEALNKKIELWLSIHKGELWGRPDWGNNLKQFQFLSPNKTVLSILELELSETLEEDIPIRIINITCKKATSTQRLFWINLVYQIRNTGDLSSYSDEFLEAV